MARVALTVQTVPSFGAALSLTTVAMDATNDHEFSNDGKTFLVVINTDVGAHSVDVVGVAGSRTWNTAPTQTLSVPAAAASVPGCGIWGPLDPAAFNQPSGLVNVNLTVDTGMRVAAFRLTDIKGS